MHILYFGMKRYDNIFFSLVYRKPPPLELLINDAIQTTGLLESKGQLGHGFIMKVMGMPCQPCDLWSWIAYESDDEMQGINNREFLTLLILNIWINGD